MRRTVSLVFVVPWGARVSSTESLLALMFAVPFISSITFHSPASSQHHLYKRLRHGIAHIINLHISAFSQCRSYHYGFFDLSACTLIFIIQQDGWGMVGMDVAHLGGFFGFSHPFNLAFLHRTGRRFSSHHGFVRPIVPIFIDSST
jgi:hypothetical protein